MKWVTVVDMSEVRRIVNLAQVVQVSLNRDETRSVHLANGDKISLNDDEWCKLDSAIQHSGR